MIEPGFHMQVYARAIDERDWPTVESLFHPDATVEGTRWTAPVSEYLPTLFTSLEPYSSTMHAMHNQYVDRPAQDQAHVVTYCVAYHVERASTDQEPDLTVGVVYFDDLRHDGERWAISHRRTELKWKQGRFL